MSEGRIPHSAPTVVGGEAAAVRRSLEAGQFGYGPRARELEARFAARTGRRHAFAVLSGTHALGLALGALGLRRGATIAVPVLTCGSVVRAAEGATHTPYLCDIVAGSLTLDAARIPPHADAIVAPHAYGAPVDADALDRLGRPWIEDCATSPTARVRGRLAGAAGVASIFSFGSTKYLTGGSGGLLATDDDGLAACVEAALSDGSGRLADLNAAAVLVQLEALDTFAAARQRIAAVYDAALAGHESLTVPPADDAHGRFRYIVRTADPSAPIAETLSRQGIDARTSVNPWLDTLSPALPGGPYPVADSWRAHLLSLPIHPSMREDDARRVARRLLEAVAR